MERRQLHEGCNKLKDRIIKDRIIKDRIIKDRIIKDRIYMKGAISLRTASCASSYSSYCRRQEREKEREGEGGGEGWGGGGERVCVRELPSQSIHTQQR